MRIFPLMLSMSLFAPAIALSASAPDTHRSHEAHVHGHAVMTVAVEGPLLEIGLESPAVNLLGFEHRPHTPQQRETLARVQEMLRDPARILSLPSEANCQLRDLELESDLIAQEHQGEESKSHADHHHDSGHHQVSDGHAEFEVLYRFECSQPAALRRIDALILKEFPGIEQLEVQWVTDQDQGGARLNAGRTTLQLR